MVGSHNFPISTLPTPYEIVWCRFPDDLLAPEPSPKARPALVRAVGVLDDGSGDVEVVYGTTNLKLHSRPYDLVISKASEMNSCGLYRATRFDLDLSVWLPWSTDWFEIRPDFFSPVIGKLTGEATKMLQITLAYKQMGEAAAAEKKGAAEAAPSGDELPKRAAKPKPD